MRGFRFRSSRPKTCRPTADEAPRQTRETTSGTQGICISDILRILVCDMAAMPGMLIPFAVGENLRSQS